MSKTFETDEDRMIYQLQLHRDTIKWICKILDENKIPYTVTRGNSAQGDILLFRQEDTSRVQTIISNLHEQFKN